MPYGTEQRGKVMRGELDVGRLFVDTKQLYLDARANAAEFDEPRLHVDVMFALVEMLGHLIEEIGSIRSTITQGEIGLKGFDADLAGLRKRYSNLYRPFFTDLPAPTQWTEDMWTSFHEDLEGPILLWDLKTCQERWGIPFGAPACEGPDLHMALSLLHQTGIAAEHHQQLLRSVIGRVHDTIRHLSGSLKGAVRTMGETMAAAFGAMGEGVADYFKRSKTAKGFAWGMGAAVVLALGGALWLNKGNNKRT